MVEDGQVLKSSWPNLNLLNLNRREQIGYSTLFSIEVTLKEHLDLGLICNLADRGQETKDKDHGEGKRQKDEDPASWKTSPR